MLFELLASEFAQTGSAEDSARRQGPGIGRSPGGLMLDTPFDFFALLIAVVAFIFARKAFNQSAVLRARLDALEAMGLQPGSGIPPEQSPASASPDLAAEQQPTTDQPEVAAAAASDQTAAQGASPGSAMPPPLPQPEPGFEERIGTRWVVWVGGLTLALGGFFMVRYSIDAGLLGPGIRTLLGGLFALALLAAGEWTRRKESTSSMQALPIANIPAILT